MIGRKPALLARHTEISAPGTLLWLFPGALTFALFAQRAYLIVMKRRAVIAKLKQHDAELKRLGVKRLYLFGSTARDEGRDDSDVDLFFDHARGKLSLFQLMDVKEFAASILGGKAEIMTCASLHPILRGQIEASALRVF